MPFGLYNLAAKLGLPDFGISESTTGYTTRTSNPYNPPLSVTPAFITPLPKQTTLSPSAEKNFYANYSTPKTVTTTVKPVTSTTSNGKVAGTSTSTSNSNPYANNADYLGRFENLGGVNDPRRIAAYQQYVQSKGTTGTTGGLTPEEQQRQATQQLISQFYDQNNAYLSDIEKQLKGNEQSYIDIASAPYNAQLPLLQSAYDSAKAINQQQQQQTLQGREDALSAARRLANELIQGTRQQYGGTSSTGEFAQALQGRELQKNQANITQTAANNLNKLYQSATQAENDYQAQVQSLEQQKQAAVLQARQQLNQQLLEIKSKRVELGSQRQQMELDALREFYANRQAIEQQANQYAQQLQATAAQARLNLQSAFAQFQANNGQPIDLTSIPESQYSAINNQVYGGPSQLFQGQIRKNPYDLAYA